MTTRQAVAALDQVVAGAKAVLEAVPDDRLNWRPHEKSWTMGELAGHLANIPSWTTPTLATSEFDIAPAGGEPPRQPTFETAADIAKALAENAARARAAIEESGDEVLRSPWTMLAGGEPRFTMPKGAVLRAFVLDHMIHHRAQLGVYLRLAGVAVPQTLGPTADFPEM